MSVSLSRFIRRFPGSCPGIHASDAPASKNRHRCAKRRAEPIGLWLCFVLLLAFAIPAGAEDAAPLPRAVTIGQLLRIVRDKSPRFAAIRTRIETARAEVVGAGVLPNPRFTYGRYQLSSRVNTMYEGKVQEGFLLEVPVLIAGQRGARVEAAERRVEATEAGVEAEFAGLLRDTWGLFVKLLASRERAAILNEAAGDMGYLRSLVAGREQAGSASPYDVLRISVEAKAVETRLENARSELAGTAGDLGILLGLPEWRSEALGNLAPLGVSADPNSLWASAEQKNPELEAMRRAEIAADAGLEQARRERWPTPTLQVGTTYTDRPYGMTPYAGISVDLPIFDRGQGGMARAAAEKQAILTEREMVAARTRVELERATELLKRRRESRARFEQEVLAKLPDLKRMAESSYRLGQGTLLELLDASRSRTEIRLSHLDLMQAETEAELDALKAAGLLVNTVEETARAR
jgi:cobalt-zinc-cadmium efflux system outer membrane protein